MRAREFIVEYDRGMTLKSWEQKLTARMASDQSAPDSIDEIMEMIESADPTQNKVYAQWIVKRYVTGDFAVDDLDQVNLRLTDYDSVKKSLTTGKDINQLTYAQLPDIISAGQAQKSAPKFEIIPDTEVLYNGPDGQLAIPKTEEASRALGSGTAWCTAYTDRPTLFDHYNSSGKIYTWRAKNGDKFQFFWGRDFQFMNSANKPMSSKDMNFFRSINPPTKKLFDEYEAKIIKDNEYSRILKLAEALADSRVRWELAKPVIDIDRDAKNAFEYLLNNKMDDPARALVHITKSPAYSFKYANEILDKKPFPAGEAVIATSAEYSFDYAEMLGKPFPAGEPAIATDANYSYQYAKLLDKPFRAGEAVIATSAIYSYYYAELLGKPFPAGEAAIATSAEYSFRYAKLLGDPFPAGEAVIATSAIYSYWYAELLAEPFPAGEAAIAKDENLASDYTRNILAFYQSPSWEKIIKDDPKKSYDYAIVRNQPFPAGEAAIATSAEYSFKYAKLLDDPFPAGEAAIATSAEYSARYAQMLHTSFPAGEPAIATNNSYTQWYVYEVVAVYGSDTWENIIKDNPQASFIYASVKKTRFPAGEAAIAADHIYANRYDGMFGTNLAQQ